MNKDCYDSQPDKKVQPSQHCIVQCSPSDIVTNAIATTIPYHLNCTENILVRRTFGFGLSEVLI